MLISYQISLFLWDIGLQFPFPGISFSDFDIKVTIPSRSELVNNPPFLFFWNVWCTDKIFLRFSLKYLVEFNTEVIWAWFFLRRFSISNSPSDVWFFLESVLVCFVLQGIYPFFQVANWLVFHHHFEATSDVPYAILDTDHLHYISFISWSRDYWFYYLFPRTKFWLY